MSYENNKQWIEANNNKLDTAIELANKLPKYQEIEPIYGSANYQFLDTKITSKTRTQITAFIDDYFSIAYETSSGGLITVHNEIYKYNSGNIELITSFTESYSSGWNYRYVFILLDTDDTYIYYIYGDRYVSRTKIYRCNKLTGDREEYFNYPIPDSGSSSSAQTYFLDRNKILHGGQHYSKVITFDMINKKASTIAVSNSNCAVRPFNKDIAIGISTGTTSYSNMKYVAYYTESAIFKEYSGNVRFVDLIDNKIMIDNSLYELNVDKNVGEKIKENFLPTTEYNEFIYDTMFNPIGDIYIYGKYIYKLNRDTYEMEKIYTLPSAILKANNYNGLGGYGTSIYYYDSSSTTYKIINFEKTTETLIGYIYNGHIFSIKTPSGVSTDKVLIGTEVFDSTLTSIEGIMPNNGELTITPSTENQNIPTGYTSGGTVEAVTASIDENIQPENIKKDVTVLGVTGTFEGSEDLQEQLDEQDRIIAEMQEELLNKASGRGKPNIFIQSNEPEGKDGIWVKIDKDIGKIKFMTNTGEHWSSNEAPIPYPFCYAAATSIGTDAYLFGSYHAYTTTVNAKALYRYDTISKAYTKLTNLPIEVFSCSVVNIEDTIYLMGSNGSIPNRIYKITNLKHNSTSYSISQVATIPFNYSTESSAVAVGTDIYLIGTMYGGSESHNREVYKFDTLKNTFTRKADLPFEYYFGTTAVFGTDIYMFNAHQDGVCKVCKYDTLTDTYTVLPNMPYLYGRGRSVTVGDCIYILGGYEYPSGQTTVKCHKYYPETGRYVSIPDSTGKFVAQSLAVINGTDIYSFGGEIDSFTTRCLCVDPVEFEPNTLVIAQYDTYGFETKLYDSIDNLFYYNDAFLCDDNGKPCGVNIYNGNGEEWIKIGGVE